MKKLFLLDAYALIYRSYYAFIKNPRINSKGLNTSAAFGFTVTLDELIRKEQPSHISVVFDPPGPTFRHEQYSDYKANRAPMPEDLRACVPYIKKIIDAFRISIIEVARFEADDVIGTLAKKAEKEDFEVFMMTPDKDYAQLISEKISMYKPRRSGGDVEVIGMKEIQEQYGVESPHQIIDMLALWGDTADNIPGAPGIGDKTAKKLVAEYGSIDGIYENIDELKGKQKENLINFRQQVEDARKLVTIDIEAPIDFIPDQLQAREPDYMALQGVFEELEFKTLASRIQANRSKQAEPVSQDNTSAVQGNLFASEPTQLPQILPADYNSINNTEHKYHILENEKEIVALADRLMKQKELCFDTETTGLDALTADIVGLAISCHPHEAYYIIFPEDRFVTQALLELLRPVFENKSILKIGQNLKYDIQILNNYGLRVKGPLFDTMLAHYLLDADGRHNLDDMARRYLSYKTVSTEELIGKKGVNQKSMREVPKELLAEYAGEDADITLQLKLLFAPQLEENELNRLFEDIEIPLINVLADMEREGMNLDSDSLNEFSEELKTDIISLESEIIALAGVQFNVGSPKQLGEILFDHLKIDPNAARTRSKQYSTSEDVLSRLKHKHEIVGKVLEYRGLRKLLNTYVDTLPGLVNPQTGKIHTSFNQAVAATGRLSSINPNLQNIPVRVERGREIRKAFVANSAEHIFLSADYSQVELRLIAHMSGDENMIAAFNRDEDIHTATAALINALKPEQVTKEMRSKAKTANFGIIYGISSFGLAQRLNIPRQEAKSLIDGYFSSYPKVKVYMDYNISFARDHGYVKTLLDRKRYLKDINSKNALLRGNAERNAINAPVQGSAADVIKIAMIRIFNRLNELHLKSKMVLQVHDELNFDVYLPELNQVREIVRYEMEHAFRLDVPLIVDIGTGKNWFEAH